MNSIENKISNSQYEKSLAKEAMKRWFIGMGIILIFIVYCSFFVSLYIGIRSLSEPREISYSHVLPRSASDVHEHTDYLQPPPDEEYRYFLKAKVTEEDFQEIVKDLELEWAYPDDIYPVSCNESWWDPQSGIFLYGKGNKADFTMRADYNSSKGYFYLFIIQN